MLQVKGSVREKKSQSELQRLGNFLAFCCK